MDEIENIIEKYRRELVEFSKNNPIPAAVCEKDEATCTDDKAMNSSLEENESSKADENCCEHDDVVPAVSVTAEAARETAIEPEPQTMPAPIVEPASSAPSYSVPKFKNYEDFLNSNPQRGSLRVQVFAAEQSFPIPNARVTVTLELENSEREMFDGLTDINGVVDDIILPTPDKEMSQEPAKSPALPYSSYTTYIEHPEFVDVKYSDVPVFSGIKSIQGIELIPLVGVGDRPAVIEDNERDSFSRLKGAE